MTELQADDFRGLSLTREQAAQAGCVYRGLREAITEGKIPPGTPLTHDDLQLGFKTKADVVTAALRGLARARLTDGSHVLSPPEPEPRNGRETKVKYVERIMRQRISTGYYAADSLLPPYRDLGRTFTVSAALVQRALAPLIIDGTLTASRIPPGIRVTLPARMQDRP